MILLNLKDENITEKIDFEISNLESLRNFFVTQKDILHDNLFAMKFLQMCNMFFCLICH